MKPYAFRYPYDVSSSLDPWREQLGPEFDNVVTRLADRDRQLEDHLSLGVAQGYLNVAQLGSNADFTNVEGDVSGLSATVTVPGGRRLRISFHAHVFNNDFTHPGGDNTARIRVMDGAAELARRSQANIDDSADVFAGDECDLDGEIFVSPNAGEHTYNLKAQVTHGPSQKRTIVGGATDTAYIAIEDIGPAR